MQDQLFSYSAAALGALLLGYLLKSVYRAWRYTRPRRGSAVTRFGEGIRLRDLYRAAVLIEEEGNAFYLRMAAKAAVPETKDLCLALAGEEMKHRAFAQEQLDAWRPLAPHAVHWPAFVEKLKAEGFFSAAPGDGASERELAAYAIRQEVKSAEFYGLFEKAFPEAWKKARIHTLVEEELRHEARLRSAYPGAA